MKLMNTEQELDSAASRQARPGLWVWALSILIALGAAAGAAALHFLSPPSASAFALFGLTLLSAGAALLMGVMVKRQADRDPTPHLQHLAQSVLHMARGDVTTPVWGIDRDDALGDIARNAEQLRQYFNEPSDIAVATRHGLLPLKLDGASGTIFQQLQENMTAALDTIGAAAAQLHDNVKTGQAETTAATEAMRQNFQHLTAAAASAADRFSQMHYDLMQSAVQTQNRQDQAAQQLDAVIPALEARVMTLTEIARLAGQHTETTLRQLQQSSAGIQETAQRSADSGRKFAAEAEALSGNMFAAITLLRNGGAALSDASSRLLSTTEQIGRFADIAARAESDAGMITTAINELLRHSAALSRQAETGGLRFDGLLSAIDAVQQNFAAIVSALGEGGGQIVLLLDRLRLQHQQILAESARGGADAAGHLGALTAASAQLIARLEAQLAQTGAISDAAERFTANAELAQQQLAQSARLLLESETHVAQATGGVQHRLAQLDRAIDSAVENVVARTHDMAGHGEARLDALIGRVEGMTVHLSALGQLAGMMGQIAAQLGALIPGFGGDQQAETESLRHELRMILDGIGIWQQEIAATIAAVPERLREQIGAGFDPHLSAVLGQIEAARQDMLAAMTGVHDGLHRRLDRTEEIGGFIADHVTAKPPDKTAPALQNVLAALERIAGQLQQMDQRLPEFSHEEDAPLLSAPPVQGEEAQGLTAMTGIFASLRNSGGDVISRLNDMAVHLQSAADKIQKES